MSAAYEASLQCRACDIARAGEQNGNARCGNHAEPSMTPAEARAEQVEAVYAAVLRLADSEMGMNAFGAENMTCLEADLFADVLRAAGYHLSAEIFLSDHAGSDEEGDTHYGMGVDQ